VGNVSLSTYNTLLNSYDRRTNANAAIVPAGTNAAISPYSLREKLNSFSTLMATLHHEPLVGSRDIPLLPAELMIRGR
jgi:hypothetical protein